MSKEIYEKALEDAFSKIEKALIAELQGPNFNWDLLIEMIIIEGSPLAELFSTKTVLLAELYFTAKRLATVADDVENNTEEHKKLTPKDNSNTSSIADKPGGDWSSFEDL